jgi:histone acetyltransferase (RNA polymerase elongator complex component)
VSVSGGDANVARHANVAIFVPHLGCPHACSFCNQREIAGTQREPSPEDVRSAARRALADLGPRAAGAEIAFFGGSFTAVERGLMVSLLEAASGFVGPGGFRGIRISTRPDAVGEDILALLRRYGVTAVELGAQSMDDRVLALSGRGHTARDVEDAARRIRAAGFELGLQMMTGLDGDTPAGALRTAERLAACRPDTVRIYPALVLRNTRLADLFRSGAYRPQTLGEAAELCAKLLIFFEEKGIRVIRLGLHAERSLEENLLAGPWHPAFREICEGRVYIERAERALAAAGVRPGGGAVLELPRRDLSKLTGRGGEALRELERKTGVKLAARGAELPKYTVRAVCG